MSKCSACGKKIRNGSKSGLCRDHLPRQDASGLLDALTEIVRSGGWCPTLRKIAQSIGCSEKVARRELNALRAAGVADLYVEHRKCIAYVNGVGMSRQPEEIVPSYVRNAKSKVVAAEPAPQRVEHYTDFRTGARVPHPVMVASQGFTPWGTRA